MLIMLVTMVIMLDDRFPCMRHIDNPCAIFNSAPASETRVRAAAAQVSIVVSVDRRGMRGRVVRDVPLPRRAARALFTRRLCIEARRGPRGGAARDVLLALGAARALVATLLAIEATCFFYPIDDVFGDSEVRCFDEFGLDVRAALPQTRWAEGVAAIAEYHQKDLS